MNEKQEKLIDDRIKEIEHELETEEFHKSVIKNVME